MRSKLKALRRRKSQAVDIRDENEQRHESLIARTGQSEVIGLLGGIGHVAASISQCDNLRSRSLCLQQIRTEVRVIERMTYGP